MTDPMASEPAEATTRPMPFDLWWSPSMKRLLTRHEDMDDEHLVWVVQGSHESLRHYLGTGMQSNPPLPDDAVRLVLADPAQTTELPRLAELAEQAGKLRTAEWVRTCASLPIEEWPPAPAYKGPMVPAAELDGLLARTAELEASIGHHTTRLGEAVAERQARIDAALQLIHVFTATGPQFLSPDETRAVRAALVGDQP